MMIYNLYFVLLIFFHRFSIASCLHRSDSWSSNRKNTPIKKHVYLKKKVNVCLRPILFVSPFVSFESIFFGRWKAKAFALFRPYESTCRRISGFGRIAVGTRYFRNWFHEPNGNDDFRLPTKAQEGAWSTTTIEEVREKEKKWGG